MDLNRNIQYGFFSHNWDLTIFINLPAFCKDTEEKYCSAAAQRGKYMLATRDKSIAGIFGALVQLNSSSRPFLNRLYFQPSGQ